MPTADIEVRVVTLDPATAALIPVEGAQITCLHSRWLPDLKLSTTSPTTDAQGRATVPISFDDGAEQSLNPYFGIAVPAPKRAVPAGAPAALRVTLPDEWETRHAVQRRLPRITDFSDANKPLELYVGVPAELRLAYTDYHSFDRGVTFSGLRNPLALPRDSTRIGLVDDDTICDDALGGFGFDPAARRTVKLGEAGYLYTDDIPTAPWAMDATAAPSGVWLDPPGAPVGRLGRGSFRQAGMLAVDSHGFVLMIDGAFVLRFYPDGSLAETISGGHLVSPGGLALDSHRNLFVADGNAIEIFRPDFMEGGTGTYVHERSAAAGAFVAARGLAVLPSRAIDGTERLAVADSARGEVQVFPITITDASGQLVSQRAMTRQRVALGASASFGAGVLGSPVSVAFDRDGRLFVCDEAKHAVSRWAPDATFTTWTAQAPNFGKAGDVAGAADGELNGPRDVAIDAKNGFLYVADNGNNRIQRFDADTRTHHVSWSPAHTPELANPLTPGSVAVDPIGDVYVADTANQRVVHGHVYDAAGAQLAAATAPAAAGAAWTPSGEPGHMSAPGYVHFAADGTLWVADTGNDRVLAFKRDAAGELKPHALPPAFASPAPAEALKGPRGVATDVDGNLFVVDTTNNLLRIYDSALVHQASVGATLPAAAPEDFDNPHGVAVVQRTEPRLYIADTNKHRVQVRSRAGAFVKTLTLPAGTTLSRPEDVAADALGNVYVADTGNRRIIQFGPDDAFLRTITLTLTPPSGTIAFSAPAGIAVDDDGKLLVTDRGLQAVLRIKVDGTLLCWWDLESLTRHGHPPAASAVALSPGRANRYDPELARLITFEAPSKAVMDRRGLLAVADPGLHHVRLVRTRTTLDLALFDLGERLPDISLKAQVEADWRTDYGLDARVIHLKVDLPNLFGGVLWTSDAHSFSSEPEEDFAGDRYSQTRVLDDARMTSTAVNTLRVVRDAARWLKHLTRADVESERWGAGKVLPRLYVDINDPEFSFHEWGSEVLHMGSNQDRRRSGRGPDAWDDSVIVHEMTHWIMDHSVHPKVPYRRDGGSHQAHQLRNASIAISEGYGEYHQSFWGSEYGRIDRVRGFAMAGNSTITDVFRAPVPPAPTVFTYLFGGPASAAAPTFTAANEAVLCEGYFSNALWQVHHAIAEPGILLAGSATYWWGYNAVLTDAQCDRYARVMRQSLRDFPLRPSDDDFAHGSRMLARQMLRQAKAVSDHTAEIVESILELNNVANPSLTVTEGTSKTAPGAAIAGARLSLVQSTTRDLIVQVIDLAGQPLPAYQVQVQITALNAGAPAGTVVFNGPAPARRHGVVTPGMPGGVTNAQGIVNVTYTAPAVPAAVAPAAPVLPKDRLVFSVQPNFDGDATFAPPAKGDGLETTVTQLYLYELRGAAKTWRGAGTNRGAIISTTIEIDVRAA